MSGPVAEPMTSSAERADALRRRMTGSARRATVGSRGAARLGLAWQGQAWLARRDRARPGAAGRGMAGAARLGAARPGEAGLGMAWHGAARFDRVREMERHPSRVPLRFRAAERAGTGRG